MARLRDSYGATSQPGERAGLSLGCFAEKRTQQAGVLCAAAAVLPWATVSRTCHGGRMPAKNLLVVLCR